MESSVDISSDNSIAKRNSPKYNRDHRQQNREENFQLGTDISFDNAIAQSNSQIYRRDHHQHRQIQNCPKRGRKIYYQVESEKPTACLQSRESEYQSRVIKTIEVTDKKSLSRVGRTAIERNQNKIKY